MKQNNAIELAFLNRLAEMIRIRIESLGYGVRSSISNDGHFNRNVFTGINMFRLITSVFIRLILNVAANADKEVFMTMWTEMGELIYKTGNSKDLENINENHNKNKNKNNNNNGNNS